MKNTYLSGFAAAVLSFTAPNISDAQVAGFATIAETSCSGGSSDDCIAAILQLRRAMAAGPIPAVEVASVQRAMEAATQNIVRNPTTAALGVAAEILTVANALPATNRNAIASNLNLTARNPDLVGARFANLLSMSIVNAANNVVLGRVPAGTPVTVTGSFGAPTVTAQTVTTTLITPAAIARLPSGTSRDIAQRAAAVEATCSSGGSDACSAAMAALSRGIDEGRTYPVRRTVVTSYSQVGGGFFRRSRSVPNYSSVIVQEMRPVSAIELSIITRALTVAAGAAASDQNPSRANSVANEMGRAIGALPVNERQTASTSVLSSMVQFPGRGSDLARQVASSLGIDESQSINPAAFVNPVGASPT